METDDLVPERCPACGEYFPTLNAVFSHHCPGLAATPRKIPELPARRTVARWFRKLPSSPRKRLVELGVRVALGPDAELSDALAQMSPRYAVRVEQKIRRNGRMARDLADHGG
jgi:hypothetical protein